MVKLPLNHFSSILWMSLFYLKCSYVESVERGEAGRVGKAVLELFEADNCVNLDDQELLQQVKEIVANAQKAIQIAKDNVDEFGQVDILRRE
jgi:hypothetical protein